MFLIVSFKIRLTNRFYCKSRVKAAIKSKSELKIQYIRVIMPIPAMYTKAWPFIELLS